MAKMTVCKACGKEIAKSAKACPNCGAKQKHHRFLFFLVIVVIVVIAVAAMNGNTSPSSKSKYALMSETEVRSGSKAVNYEDVARNPGNYKGSLVTFTGKVIQVVEGNTVVLRINQDNPKEYYSSDTWYVTYKAPSGASKILVDDKITVFGECTGTTSYKSVLGGQITIPSMILLYYDML